MTDNRNNADTDRRYRELLNAAYPFSAKGMDSAVMKQINEIKKRRVMRARIAKWGSAAACLVIAATAAITLLPKYTSKAADNVAYSMAADSAAAYDSAESCEEEVYEAPTERSLAGAYDNGYAEPSEFDFAYSAVEEVEEEVCEAEESANDNSVDESNSVMKSMAIRADADMPTVQDSAAYFGVTESYSTAESFPSADCIHSTAWRNSYHDIPISLIEAVGADSYYAWANETAAADPCAVNILNFALNFGMSRDEIYSVATLWYILDLPDCELNEENRGEIEEYYISGGDAEKMAVRGMLYSFKSKLIASCGISAYTKWAKGRRIAEISVDEMISHFNLNASDVEELFAKTRSAAQEEYPTFAFPETWEGIDYTDKEAKG